MNRVICPYCDKPAKLVGGNSIYPHRRDLYPLQFWQCQPCDAYVGCHKKNSGYGDGSKPLGRLANAELRTWKQKAHAAFDPLWKGGFMKRGSAYGWLAGQMGISTANCHIGMFDVDACKAVVQIVRELKDGKRQARESYKAPRVVETSQVGETCILEGGATSP